MLVLVAILLALSFACLLYVFWRKQIHIASNYSMFVFFSFLYSVFPILTAAGIEPDVWFAHWTLNESELIVSTHVAIVAVCNFIWAYTFYTRLRPVRSEEAQIEPEKAGAYAILVFLLYMAMCIALIIIGQKYSYTSDARTEMGSSFMSKAKVILASIYILYMARYGTGRRLTIMFFGFVVLLLVEHSRWYFVSVLFATGFYLQNRGRMTNKQIAIIALVFLLILSYVGLYRCDVQLTQLDLLLNPFYIEGDYGSYMVLQTYDLILSGHMSYCTMFADYLVDPAIYLLPRTIFVSEDVDKDAVGIFPHWVATHQRYLNEKYAPLGGFYYTAQASSALPFGGPLIITWLYAMLTISIENKRNRSSWWNLTYYLYSAGFAFVFIKTRFDLTINYYLTMSLPAYVLFYFANRFRNSSLKSSVDTTHAESGRTEACKS